MSGVFSLAMRSIRQRPGRFTATLLATFLGAAIIMMFHSLHDTAAGPGVDDVSAETLTVAASVVGGYGTLLVFFSVASTLTVTVRQRAEEMRLLRSTGATPAQLARMVVGEASVVALAGTLLAIGPGMLAGAMLLDQFQANGQVAADVGHRFGPVALGSGIGVTLLASAGAALLAARRGTRHSAQPGRRRHRSRQVAGFAALLAGAAGVAATFAIDASEPALMAAPAYGAILLSIGLAVLAPGLLRGLLHLLERPLTARFGAGGYLAALNLRHRAAELSGVLMPLTLFTGIATATLYMQAVENDAIRAAGLTRSVEDKNLATMNLVIVGIIVVFSCIMLINSLYAQTAFRSREFGQQRLAGATPGQVLRMVTGEGIALAATGICLGTMAAIAGIVAFTVVRTDALRPDQGLGVWLLIVAIAVAATLVTMLTTARRALATPAVAAVAVAA